MLGEGLLSLLPHLTQAYNVRYKVASGSGGGKVQAKYSVIRQPLPHELFLGHFAGEQGISVQPLQDDGESCQWGVIDIDNYADPNLEHTIRQRMEVFRIPCWIETSKSGGIHLYIFLDQPVIAKPFRAGLRKIAAWLGYRDAEVFPKQDKIKVAEGDTGSFCILPGYGKGVREMETAIRALLVPVKQFNELVSEGEFIDGPPCLFPLQQRFGHEGWQRRNIYLYQLSVFYRLRYPSDWKERVEKYNEDAISEPLENKELEAMFKFLEKNTSCHYKCKEEPFEAVCNRGVCQMRKFGVAARESIASMIAFESATVLDTEPPTWFITVINPVTQDTARIKLSTAELMSVAKFKNRCVEVVKTFPTLPKQAEWEAMVSQILSDIEVVPVPFDMTEEARILDLLYKFCLSSAKTTVTEGLLEGKVLIEKAEAGLICRFRTTDFLNYLERYRYRGVTTQQLYSIMNTLQQHGDVRMEKVNLSPMSLDVWAMKINSRYLELKADIDLEK